jgi:DNA-directed RNA polymerase sigma subunit (sigma70/sigma32)
MSESAIRRWNNLPTSASDVVEFKRNSYFYHETSSIDKLIPQIVRLPQNRLDEGVRFEFEPITDTIVDDFQFDFERQDSITELNRQLSKILTNRELIVITRLFGLNGTDPATYKELSEDFDLTTTRIMVIRNQALKKLRDNLNVDPL